VKSALKFLAVFFLLILSASGRTQGIADANLSWDNAIVFAADYPEIKTVSQLSSVNTRFPVVIYLHGCAGINKDALNWGSYIASLGFIVILPNSMARIGRVSNCDPKLKQGNGKFPLARKYRQEEIAYALQQTLASPWAQTSNIFLMGHSEGGIAVAQSPHAEFAGEIISGATCTNKNNPLYDAINAPLSMPVLAIASLQDEWHENKPAVMGRCIDKARGRSYFVQVDLPGSIHPTSGSPVAKNAVKDFLMHFVTK
jgi:dienelactone hydrolase